MNKSWKQIIPFKSAFKDLLVNFWHLRAFFLLIIGFILINGIGFHFFEKEHYNCTDYSIDIIIDNILPTNFSTYIAQTSIGKIILVINSLLGYILLGFILWIIQTSFSDQKLKIK